MTLIGPSGSETTTFGEMLSKIRGIDYRLMQEQNAYGRHHWNYPQYFAILHNLIYLQSSADKARINNRYRQDYEIATERHSGGGQ